MITSIENAIVDRLSRGLGKMVYTVKTYSGEIDNQNWANAIRVVPAVWVTYGGAKINVKNTARQRYEHAATFVVMCATRNLANEAAGRQGTALEVGSNDLVAAILRLLSGQRLDERLNSFGLVPKNVRTVLKNAVVQGGALSVMAVEFEAAKDFIALESERFPEVTTDENNPDWLFSKYQAQLSRPYPDLKIVNGQIYDPETGACVSNTINLQDNDHD